MVVTNMRRKINYKNKTKTLNKSFWSGMFYGFVLGYIPYIVHMNQWL